MKKGTPSLVSHTGVPAERKAELKADFALNDARDMKLGLQAYLRWLHRDDDPAQRLCQAGTPAWVMHAEKGGDGGLTPHERAVFEACPSVRVVTVPGKVFLLPNDVPGRIADLVVEAMAAA
jgi:pimeloyl-ACP methyl ester carboxylesterase